MPVRNLMEFSRESGVMLKMAHQPQQILDGAKSPDIWRDAPTQPEIGWQSSRWRAVVWVRESYTWAAAGPGHDLLSLQFCCPPDMWYKPYGDSGLILYKVEGSGGRGEGTSEALGVCSALSTIEIIDFSPKRMGDLNGKRETLWESCKKKKITH